MNVPLDVGLEGVMDTVFEMIKANPNNKDSDDRVRMRIVAHNLKGMVNVLLMADEHSDEVGVDLKQLSLGIISAAEWLVKDLPGPD